MSAANALHASGKDSDVLKIGLVGCGGRGTGAAANAMKADPHCKLVAMGDAFKDRLDSSRRNLEQGEKYGEKMAVDDAHCFVGFDSFKKVIDSVDVVLLTTSPHFRPEHYRYAIEQGKHCFVEKPVAVDAPGVRHIMETNKMAAEKRVVRRFRALLAIRSRYPRNDAANSRRELDRRCSFDSIGISYRYIVAPWG